MLQEAIPPNNVCLFSSVMLRALFTRRRRLNARSQTTDRLLQKLNSGDDSRPPSVLYYDHVSRGLGHVTLCQRHRHEQQQQQQCTGTTSSLNTAFPLLLHPCEYLATVPRSSSAATGRRTPRHTPLPPRPGRSAPAGHRNHVTSSMTSFTLPPACGDCGNADEGDSSTNLDECTSIHDDV